MPAEESERPAEESERPGPSSLRRSARRGRARGGRERGGGTARGGKARVRSRSPQQPTSAPWRMSSEEDVAPPIPPFCPRRQPGVQFSQDVHYSPVDLFKLYFSVSTMRTLCVNSNKYARKNQEAGKKYR